MAYLLTKLLNEFYIPIIRINIYIEDVLTSLYISLCEPFLFGIYFLKIIYIHKICIIIMPATVNIAINLSLPNILASLYFCQLSLDTFA